MKNLTFIFALAMLTLLTQCKKQEISSTEIPENGIQMVLKADNGGSRTDFGSNGAITWKTNEKIYVVANGQCVGYVSNGTEGGNTFTGTLNISSGTYDFHYYYVGNTQTIDNGATDFTMNFTNQDGTLANLGDFHVGYGLQTDVEVTESETVATQASMKSLVAMAYFDIAGMAETGEPVYLYGDHINNQMVIDFSTNTPTYSQIDPDKTNFICAGAVTFGSTSPVYVMLLPNHTDGTEELATDITFVSKRTTGTCNDVFNYGIIGGRFYCANGDVERPITVTPIAYDEGTLRGLFSVASENQIHFSQGNLQYQASTGVWRLAESQNDYVGNDTYGTVYVDGVKSNNKSISSSYSGWIDLFGWGTSGYNHGANSYYPYSTSQNNSDYYAYGNATYNLYDQTGKADWGYNLISNGGNTENLWRTLTYEEWCYLYFSRNAADSKYGLGNIDDVDGMILLPDDWSLPSELRFIRGYSNWSNNSYTAAQWAQMEASGAVFLPASGYRYMSDVYAGGRGYYWSASYYTNNYAHSAYFTTSSLGPGHYYWRIGGYGVRLVRKK